MELFDVIAKYARTAPDNIAFTDGHNSISYSRMWRLINANRQYLAAKGIHNQAVAYKVESQFDFAVDLLCLWAAGCWVLPIPPDVSEDMYGNLLTAHGISLFIASSCLSGHAVDWPREPFFQDTHACGIYHLTSGSTAAPKLCVRSLASLGEEGAAYRQLLRLQGTKIISLSPIYHSFAFGAAYMAALASGSAVYLVDKFIPRKAADIIGTWRAGVIIAVPVMIKAVSDVSLLKTYDFSDLSVALVGAGTVPAQTRAAFKKRFGIFVSSNYGSTETGGLTSRLTENPADSIGKEMEGVEIKLVNPDGGAADEGEAFVKCKYMMSAYLGEGTRAFDTEGYFPTGDIMTKDDRGFYYVKGRIKNVINIGGKKVNPGEVEDALLRHPQISDCMVCRAIRTDGREAVKAVVVGKGLDETSIRAYLSHVLAGYKIPSQIEFTDKIRRNALGKLVRYSHRT